MKPKLLLADSNYLLKEGLKSILLDKFHICAEVNDGEHLFEQVLIHKPDLVILNFTSNQFSNSHIPLVNAAHSDAKILAITSLPDTDRLPITLFTLTAV
jgi:DNA-binding NarL/FixJ family response regulator